jgi:uncharacterized protein with HEPN domain
MAPPSPVPRLTDIIEAIELIRSEMAGVTLQAFEPDKRKRWLVERGIEIISEASRHLSDELKARHPEMPWPKVAGIVNVLRHEYEHVAHASWHAFSSGRCPAHTTSLSATPRRLTKSRSGRSDGGEKGSLAHRQSLQGEELGDRVGARQSQSRGWGD